MCVICSCCSLFTLSLSSPNASFSPCDDDDATCDQRWSKSTRMHSGIRCNDTQTWDLWQDFILHGLEYTTYVDVAWLGYLDQALVTRKSVQLCSKSKNIIDITLMRCTEMCPINNMIKGNDLTSRTISTKSLTLCWLLPGAGREM